MTTRGITTSEFWLGVVGLVLGVVKARWIPDLPEEALYVVIAYILSRSGVKALAARK